MMFAFVFGLVSESCLKQEPRDKIRFLVTKIWFHELKLRCLNPKLITALPIERQGIGLVDNVDPVLELLCF